MTSKLRVNTIENLSGSASFDIEELSSVAEKIQNYKTKTELSNLSPVEGDAAFLSIDNGGAFVFDSSNLSTEVAVDTEEAVYIAPSSDTTGASGAWVRVGAFGSSGLDVRWFGAVGDGVVDDTNAFVKAIELSDLRGSTIFIPSTPDFYRITSTLSVDHPLKLQGEGYSPYGEVGPFNNIQKGSWLKFDHTGVGIESTGPGFISGTTLRDFGTIRNQPDPQLSGWTPNNNDFDLLMNNTDFLIDNVMLFNATKGIRLENADAGRCTVSNLRGQCFNVMIELEDVYDTTRLNDVHMWPFWANETEVTDYMQSNTTFIRTFRCDNPSFSNLFSIFTNIALEVKSNTNGTLNKLKSTNWDMDITNYGVFIEPGVDGATLSMVNTTSWGPDTPDTNSYNHRVIGTNCILNLTHVEGSNLSRGLIRVEGSGSKATISGAKVGTMDTTGSGSPIFDCIAGSEIYVTDIVENPNNGKVFDGGGGFLYPQLVGRGDSQIDSGSSSADVNHNLPNTPGQSQIQIQRVGPPGDGGEIWVLAGSVDATKFTVQLENVPTSDVWFSWRACLE